MSERAETITLMRKENFCLKTNSPNEQNLRTD